MLIYYRCYVTQEFIDFLYRVDRSAACRAINWVESLAKPLFGVKREQRLSREDTEAVMLDCTEQPIQRLGDDASQREHYSGKKKQHTLKTEYIVTEKGHIAGVSAHIRVPTMTWASDVPDHPCQPRRVATPTAAIRAMTRSIRTWIYPTRSRRVAS